MRVYGGGGPRRRRRPTAASRGRWSVGRAGSTPRGLGARTASSRGAPSTQSRTPATSAWGAAPPHRGPRTSPRLESP